MNTAVSTNVITGTTERRVPKMTDVVPWVCKMIAAVLKLKPASAVMRNTTKMAPMELTKRPK